MGVGAMDAFQEAWPCKNSNQDTTLCWDSATTLANSFDGSNAFFNFAAVAPAVQVSDMLDVMAFFFASYLSHHPDK